MSPSRISRFQALYKTCDRLTYGNCKKCRWVLCSCVCVTYSCVFPRAQQPLLCCISQRETLSVLRLPYHSSSIGIYFLTAYAVMPKLATATIDNNRLSPATNSKTKDMPSQESITFCLTDILSQLVSFFIITQKFSFSFIALIFFTTRKILSLCIVLIISIILYCKYSNCFWKFQRKFKEKSNKITGSTSVICELIQKLENNLRTQRMILVFFLHTSIYSNLFNAWKACKRLKRFGGSNPPLSAKVAASSQQTLAVAFFVL